jgi:glycosyltransferase involved in cell wall biosynthesis
MAAGVPILASRLPAHEDIIQHQRTGWLCEDHRGMTDGFAMIEDMQRNAAMGSSARAWAQEHVGTWADCAARYAVLYSELLDE